MSFKFNPTTGQFDYYNGSTDAKRLTEIKIADGPIGALSLVTATSDTNVINATDNSTYSNAIVLGVSLTSATIGGLVEILMMGKLEDPFFTYAVNDILFLGQNGVITNIPPSLPLSTHSTTIGYSLGSGSIFLNIEKPIIL